MSLSDLPYDVLSIIAMRMTSTVREIGDVATTCANLAVCGSTETTRLSNLIAKELTIRSQVDVKRDKSFDDARSAKRVHLQSLCEAVGVDPDTTNSIMRNNLSAIEGDVGDHCRIPVPAAVSIIESKWRYISKTQALISYNDRDLKNCRTTKDKKLLLYKDVCNAPLWIIPYACDVVRDEILDYGLMFRKFGLNKRWKTQTRKDCIYDIVRHLIGQEIIRYELPDSWRNSSQVYECLWNITRGSDARDDIDHINALYIRVRDDPHFNISSLPETVRMLHHLRESYEILQHVGADVESLSTDISLKCRTEVVNICLRQQAPVCLSNCSDVNANEESTISDITQIIRNVDEAYARYKYDNSLFGSNSYHVDMFVTQNIRGESMQSIIDHARCFNNLLVEKMLTGILSI
jgi:hypothetical protein